MTIKLYRCFRYLALLSIFSLSIGRVSYAQTPTLDTEEWAFLTLINNYRAQRGAGPLQVSVTLENASLWMSNDMAANNGTSHTDSGGRDPRTRMNDFGYPYYPWGENIAGGYADAQSVFTAWINSPEHLANILNASFTVIGIGRSYKASSIYRWYWTTDFGGVVDAVINAPPTVAPTVTAFAAAPSTIKAGQSATLSWTVSGASTVTIDNGIGDVSSVTSKLVSPSTTTTYTLTAVNSIGTTVTRVTVAAAPVVVIPAVGVYQLRYLANLNRGDSYINLTNAGTLNGFDPAGRLCVNVYTFDPAEEMISCCACPVTPNGLNSLSARNDLISNTLTVGAPTSVTVKLLSTLPLAGNTCDASSPTALNLVRGMRAWATTLHLNTSALPAPAVYQHTETPFSDAELSDSELAKLTGFCSFIQANGSGFGICKSCRTGALGAAIK